MDFALYGATGYTGELIARRAVGAGLNPRLAGRSAVPLARLAAELGVDHRIAAVDDSAALDRALGDCPLVLNCAGPFSRTANAIAESCLRRGAHYLDITGEIAVFEAMAARGDAAERAGVMLLPGVGFDVVPSDCLAAHVAQRLPGATSLTIAIKGSGGLSRGTATTAIEGFGEEQGLGAVRKNGRIVRVPPAWKSRHVEFNDGSDLVTTMPWGDVSTAYYSTGIQNIEVYMTIPAALRRVMRHGRFLLPVLASAPVLRWLTARVKRRPGGPSAEQRARGRSHFFAEARDDAGATATATLTAPEGYELTVRTAIECVSRALRGDVRPGFQTPSTAYGADLVLAIDGVRRGASRAPQTGPR